MKFLITSALILFSFSSQASISQNSAASATATAILEHLSPNIDIKVRGLWAQKVDAETEAFVRYQGNDNVVRDSAFDCHFHGATFEDVHCHQIADAESEKELPRDLKFGFSELQSSLEQSLDIFQRKISPIDSLIAVKLWQTDDEVYVSLIHQDNTNTKVESHFMCHVHGSHFDCHRSRNAGPQQPQF